MWYLRACKLESVFKKCIVRLLWVLLPLVSPQAAEVVWINPSGGSWTNSANWSGGSIPAAGDNVYITNGTGYTVTVQTATFAQLTLGRAGPGPILAWDGGTLTGMARIQPGAELRLEGSADKFYLGGTLTNQGILRWAGTGNLYVGSGLIQNELGGVIELENDRSLFNWFGNSGLVNHGTLRKTSGTGTSTVTLPTQNHGLIQAQSGTIGFSGGLELDPTGTLGVVILSATQFGRIESAGLLTLDGGLDVSTGLDYVPHEDASQAILGFGSRVGEFARMTGLDLGGGLFLRPVYAASTLFVALGTDGPPLIVLQPSHQMAVAGSNATFRVEAGGSGPFSYQWYHEGTPLPGETSDTLVVENVQLPDGGGRHVVVQNAFGSATSAVAELTVILPPSIGLQPSAMTVAPGSPVTFGVAVAGTGPLSYQWRRNGANIPGATNSTYSIEIVRVTDGGNYSVVVGNAATAVTSQSATLVVQVPELRPGDDFVDRMTMMGPNGELTFHNGSATREPGEPDHGGKAGSRSVWYQWRAEADGVARLSLAGSSFDTLLGVYVGDSVDALTSVAQDDDGAGFLASTVEFNVVADATYRIAIDGFAGAEGTYVMTWQFDAADPLPMITEQPASLVVPVGGEASFAVGSDGTAFEWFFNGASIPGATNSSLTISNAGISDVGMYRVRVHRGGVPVDSEPALLEIGGPSAAFSQSKFEDLFGSIGVGGGHLGAQAGAPAGFVPVAAGAVESRLLSNRGSITQPGEPNHCGVIGGASKWFGLQPITDGMLAIDTIGSSIDTVLAVYTGTDLLRLVMVACDDDGAPDGVRSQVRFPAVAGTSYAVVVDGVSGAEGAITLNWRLGVVPEIVSAPLSRAFPPGYQVMLTVDLVNTTPDTFLQWQRDGRNLFAATSPTLLIPKLQEIHAGTYSVVVGNFAGTATNTAAVVSIASAVDLTAGLDGAGGERTFRVRGPSSSGFVLQTTTNFELWTSIKTNTVLSPIEYDDPTVTNQPMRFFRVWPWP